MAGAALLVSGLGPGMASCRTAVFLVLVLAAFFLNVRKSLKYLDICFIIILESNSKKNSQEY